MKLVWECLLGFTFSYFVQNCVKTHFFTILQSFEIFFEKFENLPYQTRRE